MSSVDPEPGTPLTPSTEQYYRSIFDKADLDDNGFVDLNELSTMIENHQFDDIPPEITEQILNVSDHNHDGQLSFAEFHRMMTNPRWQHIFGDYMWKYVNFVVPHKNRMRHDTVDGSYEDAYSCCPPRLGMLMISLAEIAFFLADELFAKGSTNTATGPMAQMFMYDPEKRAEFWRYLTYMLVHVGQMHLLVNLIIQIMVGIPLELVHGWWRVLTVYLAGVLAGSLATSIGDPRVKLAGASGGVYSLITAHIATIIMNWGDMSLPFLQLSIFGIVIVFDVAHSIHNRYVEEIDGNIGYLAHFAGAIAGLLVGINILRNLRQTKKENVIWWISFGIYVTLMAISIVWNICWPNYFPS